MLTEVMAAEGLKIVLTELSEYLRNKSSQFRTQKSLNLNSIYDRAIKVENVKTIWQIDKTVNLNEFYYPSKLLDGKSTLDIETLSSFPPNSKIVIQGTAGQGKSILLRYLAGCEIRNGTKVPLFIELRKVTSRRSLEDLIIDAISSLGISVDSTTLDFILETENIILLFDAFDELADDLILDTLSYIELISTKHAHLKIVITSRPNAEIQKIVSFKVCKLKPLTPSDFKPLLNKFFSNEKEVVDTIIKSIHENEIAQLLTTPLLLTLLTITYKGYNRVPEKPHEFYEKLFHLLINRHDATKPGFKRTFKSNLNEKQMEDLFCAFSFYCMLDKTISLSSSNAMHLISKGIAISSLEATCEISFLSDCVKNTCLIVQEGFEYHFIHKSIREYHAASFIKHSPLELKEKFYTIAIENNRHYQQELHFLSVIDDFYYKKLFLIPSYEDAYKSLNWDGQNINLDSNYFSDVDIMVNNGKFTGITYGKLSYISQYLFQLPDIIVNPILESLLDKKVDCFQGKSCVKLSELEGQYKFIEQGVKNLNKWVTDSQEDYQSAKSFVNKKKDVISAINF